MFQRVATVVEHVPLAERTFRIRLACPEIAAAIRPGQFVMLRLPGRTDPLLARPFALYDTSPDGNAIEIVYLVVGKMTGFLQSVDAGETLEIWGPLGKPFLNLGGAKSVALVAGGIGQTPFLAYAKELLGLRGYGGSIAKKRVDSLALYYGVRTATLAAGLDDFRVTGIDIHLASDDGTIGEKGFVTSLLASHPRPEAIVGCGPEPMLHALVKLAKNWNVPCQVSLETPMACGIGACFSCVTAVRTPDGVDYKRVCVDGPAFDSRELAWDCNPAGVSPVLG